MYNANCDPMLIGSLPLTDYQQALKLIFHYSAPIPLWPQLPKNDKEGMVRQFLSGFPGLDDTEKRYYVDTGKENFEQEMAEFYEEAMTIESNPNLLSESRFTLGADTASGFLAFIDYLQNNPVTWKTLKGQVTGPVTTGVGIKDQHGKSILYDDNLRDMLITHLSLKAKFQIEQLQQYCKSQAPIILIDEPALVSFGSSGFAGVSAEMVTDSVDTVISAIKSAGGIAGVHICANGDWGPTLLSDADIISFDAYFYFDNFILYKEQLITYLSRGGMLAWGIVPTGDPLVVDRETTESLYERWREQLSFLSSTVAISEKQLLQQTFVAPSCGTGSLTPERATKVLAMTSELSEMIKKQYNFD